MNFCTKCGRPRGGAARFCTGCGAPLSNGGPAAAPATTERARPTGVPAQWPASVPPQHGAAARQPGEATRPAVSPETAPLNIAAVQGDLGVGDPAAGVPFRNPGGVPGRTKTGKAGFVLAGILAVLLVGGAAAWVATRHAGQAGHPAVGHVTRLAQSTPPRSEPSPTSPSARPSGGLVTVAPGVPLDGAEPSVVAFLDDYFAAINGHDFQRYLSLLDASLRKSETFAKFSAGYGTTADSGAMLVAFASGSGQVVAATITFTSHQSAADSATKTTCTSWQTTLYLHPQGGSYVMGATPASYRAIYRPC